MNLRSIRVFVLGEAEKPGSYTVSGLSTMTNALFVSGGVKKIGSLRKNRTEAQRPIGHGTSICTIYCLHGNTNADQQLMPGDVIFIPPIGDNRIGVRRGAPAGYLRAQVGKRVEQVIEIAGGLLPDADGTQAQLERIQPSRLREMRNIDLTSAAGAARNWPMATSCACLQFVRRRELRGAVRLMCLGRVLRIPCRPAAQRYPAELRRAAPERRSPLHQVRREIPPEQKVEVISADLERALGARGRRPTRNCGPRDQILVFDLSASRERVVAPVVRDLELQVHPTSPRNSSASPEK